MPAWPSRAVDAGMPAVKPRPMRRGWQKFRRAPRPLKIAVSVTVLLIASIALNLSYQVVRKPSELFVPVSGVLYKTPGETWAHYASLFRASATPVITAEFLAALAQSEASGNPLVRTYWRWSWTTQPFEIYRPASSAVGMFQITDGTFAVARRYCLQHHVAVAEDSWQSWRWCGFNSLYARVVPTHAVGLTAAYLDRNVAAVVRRHALSAASLRQKQELAAVIHLCGVGAGDRYAGRRFHLLAGQRCGDHEVADYVARIDALKRTFTRLSTQ